MIAPRRLSLLGASCALVSSLLAQPDRINGLPFATRSPVLGQHGMVCTSLPLATQAGLDNL